MENSYGKPVGVSLTGDAVEDSRTLHTMANLTTNVAPYDIPAEGKFAIWSVAAMLQGIISGPDTFHVMFETSEAGAQFAIFAVNCPPGEPLPEGAPANARKLVPLFIIPTEGVMRTLMGDRGSEHATFSASTTVSTAVRIRGEPLPFPFQSTRPGYVCDLYSKLMSRLEGKEPEQLPPGEGTDFDRDEWTERFTTSPAKGDTTQDGDTQ